MAKENTFRIYTDLNGKIVDVTDEFSKFFELDDDEVPFCDDEDFCDMDFNDDEDSECPFWGIPDIRRIIFNPPATVVFWLDGTKTVVRCAKDQPFERYAGFCAACMKKMFGSTSRVKSVMEAYAEDQVNHGKKKKKEARPVPDLTQAFNEVVANHEAAQEAINEALAR